MTRAAALVGCLAQILRISLRNRSGKRLRLADAQRVCGWFRGFALGIATLLAGCATVEPVLQPTAAPIVLAPAAPAVPAVVPPAVSARLKQDTAAVQQRARAFVAPPSTPLEAVATLEPLTRSVNRALAVMELHHTRRGYRPADVRAARAAADAVARFLDAQPANSHGELRDPAAKRSGFGDPTREPSNETPVPAASPEIAP